MCSEFSPNFHYFCISKSIKSMKTFGWFLISVGVFVGIDIYKGTTDDRDKLMFLIGCGIAAFIGFILVLTRFAVWI
jgi:hypothetical protein